MLTGIRAPCASIGRRNLRAPKADRPSDEDLHRARHQHVVRRSQPTVTLRLSTLDDEAHSSGSYALNRLLHPGPPCRHEWMCSCYS